MLFCPVCGDKQLVPEWKGERPKNSNCKTCGGFWLELSDYLDWQKSPRDLADGLQEQPVIDTKTALCCPKDKSILIRYRISADLNFNLDHCEKCRGVWLDRNEWQLLVGKGLHSKLNLFFTDEWQSKLVKDEIILRFEQKYLENFKEDYDKVKSFKEWVDSNEQRDRILAYLIDERPYEV